MFEALSTWVCDPTREHRRERHAEPDLRPNGVAVAEVLEAGAGKGFAVDCVPVVRPTDRATPAKTAPERLVLADEAGPRNIDIRAIEKVIIELAMP
jgi:hypothetical protein